MRTHTNNNNHQKASPLCQIYLATAITIFTATIIFFPSTTAPVLAATTGNSTVSSSSSGLEFSAQPIWDEQAITTGSTKINQTHSIVSFIGNGTMTVPGTGQTIKMTNNGTGLVYPIPGYAETVSAVGREHVLSTEDGDKTAITFHEIIRYDPTTFKGSGIVIAVFDRNATGLLAPFNGMMEVGTHFEDPAVRAATIKLWEWQSAIPTASPTAEQSIPSPMNITTTNSTTASDDTNAIVMTPIPPPG